MNSIEDSVHNQKHPVENCRVREQNYVPTCSKRMKSKREIYLWQQSNTSPCHSLRLPAPPLNPTLPPTSPSPPPPPHVCSLPSLALLFVDHSPNIFFALCMSGWKFLKPYPHGGPLTNLNVPLCKRCSNSITHMITLSHTVRVHWVTDVLCQIKWLKKTWVISWQLMIRLQIRWPSLICQNPSCLTLRLALTCVKKTHRPTCMLRLHQYISTHPLRGWHPSTLHMMFFLLNYHPL